MERWVRHEAESRVLEHWREHFQVRRRKEPKTLETQRVREEGIGFLNSTLFGYGLHVNIYFFMKVHLVPGWKKKTLLKAIKEDLSKFKDFSCS